MISRIESEADYPEVVRLMRLAFGTVAAEFGLTEANAPTNPAFVTVEGLRAYLAKPVELFGMFEGGALMGCVAVEPAEGSRGVYYLERLAVAPNWRHQGRGSALLDHALARVRGRGGRTVSIALINENRVLKEWYQKKGFREAALRRFPHLPFEVCFMERAVDPGGCGSVRS